MKTPRDVVQDWVAAYNRRDAHAAAKLCHEDATNLQVALGEPTIGRQAMLDNVLSFFHAFPDASPARNLRARQRDWEESGRRVHGGVV